MEDRLSCTYEEVQTPQGRVVAISPNLPKRNFEAGRPNQKWVTNVTEFSLFEKNLYLSPDTRFAQSGYWELHHFGATRVAYPVTFAPKLRSIWHNHDPLNPV